MKRMTPKKTFLTTKPLGSTAILTATALALTVTLLAPNPARAGGIPVIDAADISQEAIQHAQELAEMINQLNELRAQTQELIRQYEEQVRLFNSIANIRSFDDFFRAFARVNAQLEYGSLGNLVEAATGEEIAIPGEITSAMGDLRQLYNLDGLRDFASTGRLRNETAADLGKFGLILASLGEQGMNAFEARTEQTDALRAQVGQQEDLKAAVDFNSGVQVEMLQALNELNMRLAASASIEGRREIERAAGKVRADKFVDDVADTELQ